MILTQEAAGFRKVMVEFPESKKGENYWASASV